MLPNTSYLANVADYLVLPDCPVLTVLLQILLNVYTCNKDMWEKPGVNNDPHWRPL